MTEIRDMRDMILTGTNKNIGEFRLVPLKNIEEDYQICKDIFTDERIMATASLFNTFAAKEDREIRDVFNLYMDSWDKSGIGEYKILDSNNNTLGIAGFIFLDVKNSKTAQPVLDLGYFLKIESQSKYLGSDVVDTLIKALNSNKNTLNIIASVKFDNIPSQLILLKQGFVFNKRIKKNKDGVINCYQMDCKRFSQSTQDKQELLKIIEEINSKEFVNNTDLKSCATLLND